MSASVFGRILAWCLVAIALIFNVLGYALDLYSYIWWFDRVLHCGTLFAMTFWGIVFLVAPTIRPDHARPIVVFCLLASTGIAIGALWEIVEWGFDLYTVVDSIKGKYDTILDIIMDAIGSALATAAVMTVLTTATPAPTPIYERTADER